MDSIMWIFAMTSTNILITIHTFLSPNTMACGTWGCRQESSLTRCDYRPCSPPGQCIVWEGRSGTTMPVHLTETCHWHLYDSFDANTLHPSGLAKPVCCKTVADVSNNNLEGPQRELIQWHSNLLKWEDEDTMAGMVHARVGQKHLNCYILSVAVITSYIYICAWCIISLTY